VDRQRTQSKLRHRVRRLLLASSIAAIFGAVQASAASAEFQTTLPLNPGQLTDARLNAALDMARDAGVTQIQSYATWWYLTRNGGPRSYDWTDLDRLVAAAQARGMRVVLQLNGTPDWVHPDLRSSVPDMMNRIWYPPVRNDAELGHWSDFVKDVVSRYRGKVSHYEIWNEQNWRDFWKPEENVDDYARMLRASYYAARQADPGATVVFGGMTTNDIGYLRAYYDSAERQWPGEAAAQHYFFDVLGAHPYSAERSPRVLDPAYTDAGKYGEIDRNFLGFRRLKQLMDERDSAGKGIFIGEYGFSTTDTWMKAVPDAVRAQHLRDAYSLAAAEGYVTGMAWYAFVPNTATGPEWTIVDENLNPSQTFNALRGATSAPVPSLIGPGASPSAAGSAGETASTDVTPPKVRVKHMRKVSYRRAVTRGVPVAVRCSEDCSVSTEAIGQVQGARRTRSARGGMSLGRASGESDRGHLLRMRVRLRRKPARRLVEHGGKRVRLSISARDDAGNEGAAQRVARVTS
jgi:hypothetical protein